MTVSPYRACFLLLFGSLAVLPERAHAASSLSPVSIRFLDQATVAGERIRLGDVARIMAGDAHIIAELETLEVAKSAGFGLTRLLDTDLLYSRCLKGYLDRYLFDYDHKNIHVTTLAAILPADSLSRLMDAFIASQPKAPGEIRRWEIARAPEAIMVPMTPYELELSFLGARRKGKVDVNLAIRGGNRVLRNVILGVNLRVEQPVLVSKCQIGRDTPLGKDNVSVEMRETTQINDLAVMEPKKMVGFMAKVTIAPGRIITPRLVVLPPAVKRGQEAKIVFRNGGVSVSSDAVCRQDGIIGQIITAKSLANNRLVRVRVTEDGRLEPVPGG
jgi:flagella basal body P-ring formation protein FlgA